jgi:hypothetical protein
MRHITFVLKGISQLTNYALCLDHGLTPQLIALTDRESVYRTGYDNLAKVAAWYAEPSGSCLIYSIHDGEHVN